MKSCTKKPCKHPCCPDEGPCRKLRTPKKRVPLPRQKSKINAFSAKRTVENRKYSTESKEWLKSRPKCEINAPGCTLIAVCVNHRKGRGKLLRNQRFWEASCAHCNIYIESHDEWARQNGHKISRHFKTNENETQSD